MGSSRAVALTRRGPIDLLASPRRSENRCFRPLGPAWALVRSVHHFPDMNNSSEAQAHTLAAYSSPSRYPSIRPSRADAGRDRALASDSPALTMPPAACAAKMFKVVRQVASRMARRLPRHVDVEDLVGAGALGLADAFSRRNGMPSSEFEAFASYRIRGAMLDELRRLDAMSRRTRARARRVAKAQRAVEQRSGGDACVEEVAKELGMEIADYQALQGRLATSRGPVPLRAPANDEDDWGSEVADVKAEMLRRDRRADADQRARRRRDRGAVRSYARRAHRALRRGADAEGDRRGPRGELSRAFARSTAKRWRSSARGSPRAKRPPASCTRLRKDVAKSAQGQVASRRSKGA